MSTAHDLSERLAEFLDRLAAGTPTPGGGAAAAITGSIAAALVAMAARVTARRAADPVALAALATSADEYRHELLALAARDEAAYRAVIDARRAGPEVAARDRALRQAIEVPVAIARASYRVLELARSLAAVASRVVASDVAVAVTLAAAAVDAAAATTRANLGDGVDRVYAGGIDGQLAALTADADRLRRGGQESSERA